MMTRINDIIQYRYLQQNFPHVARKLYNTWGTMDFVNVVDSFLLDTRNGTRRGFPHEAVDILLLMINIHQSQ